MQINYNNYLSFSLRQLSVECLQPFDERIEDMASIVARLRDLQTSYCSRSAEELHVLEDNLRIREELQALRLQKQAADVQVHRHIL